MESWGWKKVNGLALDSCCGKQSFFQPRTTLFAGNVLITWKLEILGIAHWLALYSFLGETILVDLARFLV